MLHLKLSMNFDFESINIRVITLIWLVSIILIINFITVLTLDIHYPPELNWEICLIKGFKHLVKSHAYKEKQVAWTFHNVTSMKCQFYFRKKDLSDSPTVMHQEFFDVQQLRILRNTYGGDHGKLVIKDNQHFTVTAAGPAHPNQVLMRIEGVHDLNRTHSFTMELNHTGDGTKVSLRSSS